MTTSSEVPARFPVAINGRPYMIDPAGYRRETLPVIREQADTSGQPAEASLNPKDLWRRAQESWHHGAGQVFLDGRSSDTATDPERFNTSGGIDCWTRGQLGLLPAAEKIRTITQTNLACLAVGNRLYVQEGDTVSFASDPHAGATWSNANIHGADAFQDVKSITTDGNYIWAALGTSGIHRTTRGATSSTANVPGPLGANHFAHLVGYANGRLLAASSPSAGPNTQRNVLWEITENPAGTWNWGSTPGTPLVTHADPNFVWTGIRPGRNCIYAFGNVLSDVFDLNLQLDYGGKAEVYRIGIVPTDGSLAAPIFATYLPDGESIHDVRFYAGGAILATSRGVRLGVVDGQGNIDYGPLIATEYPVAALEPQDRYCWFSRTNDPNGVLGTRTGLGRLDLGFFTDNLTPVWAPDLTTGVGTGNVSSIASLAGLPGNPAISTLCFAVNSGTGSTMHGVWRTQISGTTTVKTSAGEMMTGQIRYGISDPKKPRWLDIRHRPLPTGALLTVLLYANGQGTGIGATNSTANSTRMLVDLSGLSSAFEPVESLEVEFSFSRATDTTTGPEVTRWTLKALPVPYRNETFTLPLLLRSYVDTLLGDGDAYPVDIDAEITALKTLERDSTVFQFQVGEETFDGYIDLSQHQGEAWSKNNDPPNGQLEGVYTVRIITVGS